MYTGRIWHGYSVVYHPESEQLFKIQNKTPVMIIYYHGAVPLDLYYLVMFSELNNSLRKISTVIDRFMYKLPFLSATLGFWNCVPGPRDEIIEQLCKSNIVALSPGGTREAIFSKNYELLWGNRTGFAECLISTRSKCGVDVAVIPMFTKNLRSSIDYPYFVKSKYIKYIYENFRWPLYPLFGGFPVRLTTYLGQPLYITRRDTDAKKVAKKIKVYLEQHILEHQLDSNISESDLEGPAAFEFKIQKLTEALKASREKLTKSNYISIFFNQHLRYFKDILKGFIERFKKIKPIVIRNTPIIIRSRLQSDCSIISSDSGGLKND